MNLIGHKYATLLHNKQIDERTNAVDKLGRVASGQWAVGSGQSLVDSGQWTVVSGQSALYSLLYILPTVDCRLLGIKKDPHFRAGLL